MSLKRNDEIGYKDEGKHSKFVSNIHFIHDIENINPFSAGYKKYWREMKKRCMEGYWFEGKWMPGPLYFYINFCKIHVGSDSKDKFKTGKTLGRPFLRDLEWEKGYIFMEARGFSGFEGDDEITCNRLITLVQEKPDLFFVEDIPQECYKKDGTLKRYEPARTYLKKTHTHNYGKPLFQNDAKNVIDIESRGTGKSFWAAGGMCLHTFLMDGMYDYDLFRNKVDGKEFPQTTITVGAIDGKYTKDFLGKVLLAKDNLIGAQTVGKVNHKCPLDKGTSGSFYSGKQFIENYIQVKQNNDWTTVGSGSKIYNVSFKDNPEAGNGKRSSLVLIEETGFMDNLEEAYSQLKDTQLDGSRKFGSTYMFGTGGQMEKGASEPAKKVFNNPREFDCLIFNDEWEDTGEIGYFVPVERGLNDCKDDEGITQWNKAFRSIDARREPLYKASSKKQLYKEMQNNPRVPSEAFLVSNANMFPTAELKAHLNTLRASTDASVLGQVGELVWEENKEGANPFLKWKPCLDGSLKACEYRVKKDYDTTGAIQIWEHPFIGPEGKPPHGLYLAGTDPYDQDSATSSASLGSTFIYKTFKIGTGTYNIIVAEYTARPATAAEHHENVRKLLLYYNARDLYENERNTLKMHFEHKNSLYLLNNTPTILKATANSKVDRTYGIHMTDHIKAELEIYTRDWLEEKAGDGKLNLHNLYSVGLIEELINYNDTGNFDRVIAFMLVICNKLQNYKNIQAMKEPQEKKFDPFISKLNKLFT